MASANTAMSPMSRATTSSPICRVTTSNNHPSSYHTTSYNRPSPLSQITGIRGIVGFAHSTHSSRAPYDQIRGLVHGQCHGPLRYRSRHRPNSHKNKIHLSCKCQHHNQRKLHRSLSAEKSLCSDKCHQNAVSNFRNGAQNKLDNGYKLTRHHIRKENTPQARHHSSSVSLHMLAPCHPLAQSRDGNQSNGDNINPSCAWLNSNHLGGAVSEQEHNRDQKPKKVQEYCTGQNRKKKKKKKHCCHRHCRLHVEKCEKCKSKLTLDTLDIYGVMGGTSEERAKTSGGCDNEQGKIIYIILIYRCA